MIRLLILVMVGAIALALAYFFFKSIPMAKKMLAVGGGLAAAIAAVALQGNDPFYMPFLAIIGVALLATLVYMKLEEKRQLEQQRYAEERKSRLAAASSPKNASGNRFSMSPVETGKGEQ
ncbi:hypothetical protein KQ939_06880 [Planococcus sp. CP5-4]|uniref:hypothetical protein n=1 Tax=unclassified Planococcus (in: firmicutes) TaxID=2662419 RepID=UPI001C24C187|nr:MULTISPECIES: hypothetical protein [unclassified Planococcus (in: firmicutes)]MBU9672905.1 hypothetical protein [Planococcus sp. CP5-4_YE]MBV0908677.1 hypothetical protein [Planococcus sp. CP5-4_UN]MBW6063446.1 hypothetical protein [Planococcus sp. CP5-4]